MEFAHYRPEHIILLDNLKNEVIHKTLAYMVDFKEHKNLVVIPKTYSIEISNAEICIAVIIFSGFEKDEYQTILTKDNFHIVSFNTIFQTMLEFKNIFIKYIDPMALFFTSLERTNDANIKDFLYLKNPSGDKTIHRLKKEYSLKEAIWNQDLFSLLYKKHHYKSNSKKTKNNFTTSIALESFPEAFNEDNLKNISSSLIKEFVENKKLLTKKENQSELDQSKPFVIGFAVVSGKKRAKKSIEMALSSLSLKNCINTKNHTVLLLISSDKIGIDLDEIGIINDYIQEKLEYTADIIMHVNEEKNLGEAIAITIIISDAKILR